MCQQGWPVLGHSSLHLICSFQLAFLATCQFHLLVIGQLYYWSSPASVGQAHCCTMIGQWSIHLWVWACSDLLTHASLQVCQFPQCSPVFCGRNICLFQPTQTPHFMSVNRMLSNFYIVVEGIIMTLIVAWLIISVGHWRTPALIITFLIAFNPCTCK